MNTSDILHSNGMKKSHKTSKSSKFRFRRKLSLFLFGFSLILAMQLYQNTSGLYPQPFHLISLHHNSGMPSAQGWNLVLVNSSHHIPYDYPVALVTLKDGHQVDRRIYPQLQQMFDAARASGVYPIVVSGFRTYEKQEALLKSRISEYQAQGYSKADAEKEAEEWVAIPGTSEHQTGLAVDIAAEDNQMLDGTQAKTKVQKWLIKNSYKYGFVLRYPADKSNITGINYEPWHYRYVGKDAAMKMHQSGQCLEEYLESQQNS